MNASITTDQQQALDANGGIAESGDVVFMRMDVFRDMLGFSSDEELRALLRTGFDQADRGQWIEWNPDRVKAEGRRRLQQNGET